MASISNSRNYHYSVGRQLIVRICQTLTHVFDSVIGPTTMRLPAYYRLIEICKSAAGRLQAVVGKWRNW